MAVFPTLDFTQIKARYPKAVAKIQEWVFNQPELQAVTDEFVDPKKPEESKEMFVGLLIQMDPRKLYDIFDSLGYLVTVHYEPQLGVQWHYLSVRVNSVDDSKYGVAPDRHSAEQSAFHDAFELLEKQS